jgi:hypothetical protein
VEVSAAYPLLPSWIEFIALQLTFSTLLPVKASFAIVAKVPIWYIVRAMSYVNLLRQLGFEADPFAKTNADDEERLGSYFIEPPFFKAVYGDLAAPKSAVVFAPRGGGKTALKRMIELSSLSEPFMCITYNQFNVAGLKLQEVDLDYHLRNITRLLLVAVISSAADRGLGDLTSDDRHIIFLLTKEYLSEIVPSELKAAVSSVQNLSDKAKEWWNKFTGPIGIAINALLAKIGLAATELDKFSTSGGRLGSLLDQITILGRAAIRLGYECVYILIDKVDENTLTGRASTSYRFISPVVSDLQLLELPSFGFKFFLWDLLIDDYRAVARPDRVKYYNLRWGANQLKEMLAKRLSAHSADQVRSLSSISSVGSAEDVDAIVALFSQGSPRNTIRICKEILDQQSELDSTATTISREAIIRGFDVFAKNYTNEILDEGIIRDLQKIKRADFTVKYIYTDIFRFT